jgi:hypothetical protein
LRIPRIARNHVATLISGLLIGTLLVGSAIAVTSPSFKYAHPKTGYLNLSPMAFSPDSLRGATDDYFNSWGSQLSNDDSSRCFNTGVSLPQGAKMKEVTYYYQSDATSDLFAEIVRMNPAANSSTTFANASPADDSDVATSITVAVPSNRQAVNNTKYSYGLGVCPFDGTVFMGARIKYTYTSAGA